MKMDTFGKFLKSGSLHFCRADLFEDEHEGLPLEEHARQSVATLSPDHSFESTSQALKEDRRGSFISCWTLEESLYMWNKFAPEGVAVQSSCGN